MVDPTSRAITDEQAVQEPKAQDAHGIAEGPARTQWQLAWKKFRQHKLAVASLFILVVLYLAAIFAPIVAPFDPNELDLDHVRESPSLKHPMGTDALGRDEFSRVVYGGRISLAVGMGVALSAGFIGTTMGALAGFYGRWVDAVLMRTTDFFLAMPVLAVLLVAAKALGGSITDIVVILAVLYWMPVARIVRNVFMSLKEKEYVEGARASGAGSIRIIVRHLLPNSLGPIIVNVTLGIAIAILTESLLSFLGFGIQPPTATWGNMLSSARDSMLTQPWLVWFPGFMILLTVLCVNFLGDGLRDALDPAGHKIRT